MIGDKSQSQTAGDSSLNIQAQNLHISGVSAGEARQIAIDVYRANFSTLAQEAVSSALARAEFITDDLISKLAAQDPQLLRVFREPGMQLTMLSAQREYARTGDKTVEELLVSVLIDRAKENSRSLRQIALDESVAVIPKLTEKQVDILTINTLANDHYFIAGSDEALKEYLSTICRFKATIRFMSPDIRHLEFAGCAKLVNQNRRKALDVALRQAFPGLFPAGFTREKFESSIPSYELFKDIIVPFGDSGLLRLNAISNQHINAFFHARGLTNDLKKPLFDLLNSSSMTFENVRARLLEIEPGIDFLFSFDNHDMLDLELTPVGIAIACANFKRRMGFPLAWPYHMRDT